MSAQIPPDPITDTFNPAAWTVPEFTPEEQAVLDANFVKYPITQNNTITFPISPIAPTLADGTNTTQVATTGFVQNAIAAFTSTVNTWLGTQIFSVGMTSNTINPTTSSGILIIGNAAANTNVEVASSASRSVILHLGDGDNNTNTGGVHIGNGATSANNVRILDGAGSTGTIFLGSATSTISLGCPLTPNYATLYSATTGTGTGKIGQIIIGTNLSQSVTANTPKSIASIDLPQGIWLLYITSSGVGSSVFFTIAFSTTTNSITTGVIAIDTCPVAGTTPTQTLTYPVVAPAPVSPATSTTYYAVASTGITTTLTFPSFSATRIA